MTVQELIEILSQVPLHLPVVLSKDSEGNGFSPLADWSPGIYDADSSWSGDFTTWHDDEGIRRIEVDEANVICLWPTN